MYESKSIHIPNDIVVAPINSIACLSISDLSSSCTLIKSLYVDSYWAVRPYRSSVVDESSATAVSFSLPPLVMTTEPLTM